MAKPGPKPGFKRSPAPQATAAPAVVAEAKTDPASEGDEAQQAPAAEDVPAQPPEPTEPPAPPVAEPEPAPAPSTSDRENPDKLHGQELRELAHRRGIALSTLCFMSDEKIRLQLRYITYRQYDDDAVG